MKKRIIRALIGALAVSLLSACYYGPMGGGYVTTDLGIGMPAPVFTFENGLDVYYMSAYGAYVYGEGGVYYRWANGAWFYTRNFGGPWFAVTGGTYLPPALLYGPPPPTVAYRPYFLWWRQHAAPWYSIHHPGWWRQHRPFMGHYDMWRRHFAHPYPSRPFFRPGGPQMGPRFGGGAAQPFYGPGPGRQQMGPGPRAFQGPGYPQRQDRFGRPGPFRGPGRFQGPGNRGPRFQGRQRGPEGRGQGNGRRQYGRRDHGNGQYGNGQ